MTLPARIVLALAATAITLAGCGDDGPDDATRAACEQWSELAAASPSDQEAVRQLNEIADISTNRPVRDKALALAIALEGSATQTEVRQAYEAMDAACVAATD